jgi:hypothetical protein
MLYIPCLKYIDDSCEILRFASTIYISSQKQLQGAKSGSLARYKYSIPSCCTKSLTSFLNWQADLVLKPLSNLSYQYSKIVSGLVLIYISNIDYKLKLLSNNLDLLQKLKDDLFSSIRTADINKIQDSIGLLLKFLSSIEAIKDQDSYSKQKHRPYLARLQKQYYNI